MMKRGIFVIPAAVIVTASVAQAGTIYDADANYFSAEDSPFAALEASSEYFYLESWDGVDPVAITGYSFSNGSVMGASQVTDSVDADDFVVDGFGLLGTSYFVAADEGLTAQTTITFDADELGALPNYAGVVLTDAHKNAILSFSFLDSAGDVLGTVDGVTYGDGNWDAAGATLADRFVGGQFEDGIYQIVISSDLVGFELDHLQMGFDAAVIPLPPAAALGIVGLGLVGLRRRRAKA